MPGFDRNYSLFDTGFDASWEIDLWGGTRRAVEAARRRIEAADAQRHEVRLRIVAEVARAYAELRGAQAEAAALRAEADAQRTTASLVRQMTAAGETGAIDAAQAEAQARSAQAALPGAEARIIAAANMLALLTAQPPEALQPRLLAPAPIPPAPALMAVGLRSDVLRRRPDITAAEAQLAAATADVGSETANLFPRLSLMGSLGQQARNISDIGADNSTRFQIGPSLRWPVFAGGRIRAQIRAAHTRADGAAAAYEQAVLGALADSETALNRYAAAVQAAQDLAAARDHATEVLRLEQLRFKAGEDDRLALLQATARQATATRAAASAAASALAAHATLVKALGGGWRDEPAVQTP
jgi:NodT family efflux transporter outer membrane factor (OMF) lipoprotein